MFVHFVSVHTDSKSNDRIFLIYEGRVWPKERRDTIWGIQESRSYAGVARDNDSPRLLTGGSVSCKGG